MMHLARLQAKEKGQKEYITGKPCIRGHVSARRTSTGACLACEPILDSHRYQRDKEKRRANYKKWAEKNLNRIANNGKRWAINNPDKVKQSKLAWANNNPAKVLANTRKRQTQKIKACPVWVNTKEIERFYLEAKTKSQETGIRYHVDHIIPLRHPAVCGLHVPWNLQIITAKKNLEKGNKFNANHTKICND